MKGGWFGATLEGGDGSWEFLPREGVWFPTSDCVKICNGGLTVVGRVDRSIKVLGELINLAGVEKSLGLEG